MDSQAKFASLNLAIVLVNGSVWDISFDDRFMAIAKKLLIQLPKSKPYFSFSSNINVLNFVRNDLSTNIIQYHRKLNKQGHMTIKKSSVPIKLIDVGSWVESRKSMIPIRFKESIQVGNMLWVLGAVVGKTKDVRTMVNSQELVLSALPRI